MRPQPAGLQPACVEAADVKSGRSRTTEGRDGDEDETFCLDRLQAIGREGGEALRGAAFSYMICDPLRWQITH